ncbi:MAG: methylmalonyl-CoA mutase family protein [Chloroflexota bacterium]|nr:methylmalonyl-CoA mutase family protein [Chloroflexota bacterium]
MYTEEELREIEKQRKEWEEGPLRKSLQRFGLADNPTKFCTPLDVKGFSFLDKVGFPGEYPFTAGKYGVNMPPGLLEMGLGMASGGRAPAGGYSGYGTAEDTRDHYKNMQSLGMMTGPNIAFDLPTQCGYDSDDASARGEVGKVGVAIDTLHDFEIIYEAFTGSLEIDKISSNWTINGMTNIIIAMYIAIAEKRGVPLDKLRATPQNDILKEYIARGTYTFPIKASMRMTRDTMVYCTQNMPNMNTISISGYHIREAGANPAQVLAFTLSDGIAYMQEGVNAGLDIDSFAPRTTFLNFGGTMEVYREIALYRALRRVWGRIMKDRFNAKNPRSWMLRGIGGPMGCSVTTAQRPLNNLSRGVIQGVASALCGEIPAGGAPFDEPLGLGHSREGMQLTIDAARIMVCEARLCDVADPVAGSFFFEALTDEIEQEGWALINKIDEMGGAPAAIEKGFPQREIARSAHEWQRQIEAGERTVVGVNKFVGEQELDVLPQTIVEHPYDPKKRAAAEEKQIDRLTKIKKERDNEAVQASLKRLKEAAQDDSVNLIPPLVESVKLYASLGEMTKALKEVFGEYQSYGNL